MTPIMTSCKQCIFAQYNGNTQTGCSLSKLEKYKSLGVNIIEAYDEEKEFYIIEDRICRFLRTKDWAKNDQLSELIDKVNQETLIKCDCFILCENNIKNLYATIHSINALKMMPNMIYFLFKEDIKQDILTILSNIEFPFKIKRIFEQGTDLRILDIAVSGCKSSFYSIFREGFTIPKNYFNNINQFINDKLGQFCLLKPYNIIDGLTVFNMSHKSNSGNMGSSIIEKLEIINKEENGKMVLEAEKLCPL